MFDPLFSVENFPSHTPKAQYNLAKSLAAAKPLQTDLSVSKSKSGSKSMWSPKNSQILGAMCR